MNSAFAMSRLDAPANTRVKISRSRGVKPSEPGDGDGLDSAAARNVGNQRPQGRGLELSRQSGSGGQLTCCGAPVAGRQLSFGNPQARVRLVIRLSQRTPAITYARPLVSE